MTYYFQSYSALTSGRVAVGSQRLPTSGGAAMWRAVVLSHKGTSEGRGTFCRARSLSSDLNEGFGSATNGCPSNKAGAKSCTARCRPSWT